MDIGDLLFLLFILLPLLSQLFTRRKGEPELPPPPREDEGWSEPAPEPRASTATVPADRPFILEPEGGWGDWAVDVPEGDQSEEGLLPEELGAEEEAVRVSEAERVEVQVVSMEPLHVDRPAEHARLHRAMAQVAARRPARPRAPALSAALAGREELRRAILVSEVLGPPKSLR